MFPAHLFFHMEARFCPVYRAIRWLKGNPCISLGVSCGLGVLIYFHHSENIRYRSHLFHRFGADRERHGIANSRAGE